MFGLCFKICVNNHSCVNAAIQFGGITALDGPEDSLKIMVEKFIVRRDLIHKGLNNLKGVECSKPLGALYAFPNVKGTGMNGSEFAKKCLHEAGVAISPIDHNIALYTNLEAPVQRTEDGGRLWDAVVGNEPGDVN